MTAQEYIESTLQQLKEPVADIVQPKSNDELVQAIFNFLTSKKFRKYSLTPEYSEHIKKSIRENVDSQRPINLTFLGGCYKLWRLDEAPESDWAELFAHIYYTRWVLTICAIYKPGVWFDYFLDDAIVSRLNNISEDDVEAYRKSRQKILDYLKPYQPNSLHMTLTGLGSLFNSRHKYEEELEKSIDKLARELPGGLPKLSEGEAASTELNVKATDEQKADPKWREKVELVHSAYMNVKADTGYAGADRLDKIRVFTQPFSTGTCIAVGTTKDSIAKFWAGVGALRPKDDSFRQIVLSPSQLKNAKYDWQDLDIGLSGKNFRKIRVLK